jgi:hypothetical protein
MHLREWGKRQPLRVFGVPALQLFNFSCGHLVPVVEVRIGAEKLRRTCCGEYGRVVGGPRRVNC